MAPGKLHEETLIINYRVFIFMTEKHETLNKKEDVRM